MSYHESQVFLAEAAEAFSQGNYGHAGTHYAAVVAGLAPQAVAARPLTPDTRPLVQHFAAASRGQSTVLAQQDEPGQAVQVLLAALTRLRGCLSNLGTPAMERAPLVTEYKLCFYALADQYFANGQLDDLAAYTRCHAPELARWSNDLHLVRAAQGGN